MNNYQFCVQWAVKNGAKGKRVLDYGCGAGNIVVSLRESGIEAYGCEMFFEGGLFGSSPERIIG